MKKFSSVCVLILWIAFLTSAFAGMDVPASFQAVLFYKIFDFDRTLANISGQEVMMGVFYNPKDAQSIEAKDKIKLNFAQLNGIKISGKNMLIKEITEPEEINGMHIVYVTPGSDSFINDIVNRCKQYKVLSISGVEKYSRQGVAITLKLEKEKSKIVINSASVQACGANLSSKLLALAQVI